MVAKIRVNLTLISQGKVMVLHIGLEQENDDLYRGFMSLGQLKQVVNFMESNSLPELTINWDNRNMRICGEPQEINLSNGRTTNSYPILLEVSNTC